MDVVSIYSWYEQSDCAAAEVSLQDRAAHGGERDGTTIASLPVGMAFRLQRSVHVRIEGEILVHAVGGQGTYRSQLRAYNEAWIM
jgi:hypothetical protein